MSNKKPENGNNAEWRGYVKAKLERIPIIEEKVDDMWWTVAKISGTVSVVVTLVVALVIFVLKGS